MVAVFVDKIFPPGVVAVIFPDPDLGRVFFDNAIKFHGLFPGKRLLCERKGDALAPVVKVELTA